MDVVFTGNFHRSDFSTSHRVELYDIYGKHKLLAGVITVYNFVTVVPPRVMMTFMVLHLVDSFCNAVCFDL